MLPKGTIKIFRNLSGDGKISTDDNLSAFHTTCGVISVPSKEIVVRLFVQMHTDVAINWFDFVPHYSIVSWEDMKIVFESRFKNCDNECSLLLQLS